MAKKNRDNAEQDEKKGGLLTVIIVLVIIAIWIAIFALLVHLDVGGLGTSLRPMLKDIPVINKILPPVSDEELAWENDLAYKDIIEANQRIKELEILVDKLTIEGEDKDEEIAALTAQVNRLKELEKQMADFEDRVYEFDKKIVFAENAPSIDEYIKWYETISPENAERIYEIAIQKEAYNATIKEKANYYEKMKASAAAEVFENMTADLEYVCKLLYCMKVQSVSDILAQMDPLFAAKNTRKMKEMDEARFDDWVLQD
jgi:flagellar motility protein MotE (MotC chaperone)